MPASHFILPARCPSCLALLDTATGLDHEDPPKPGDVTVCIACATLLKFDDHLSLQTPTDRERREAMCDPFVRGIVIAARARIAGQ